MKKLLCLLGSLWIGQLSYAQETYPVNGVADRREGTYAFTNATIVKDAQNTLKNATMVIRDGKIVAVGTSVSVPKDAVLVDCKDKYLYPSFIDIYSDYGTPADTEAPPSSDTADISELLQRQGTGSTS